MTDPTAGGGGVDFLTSLPAEMQSDGVLKAFAGPDGGAKLAKSYTELTRTFHSRTMADMDAPGDDAGLRAVLEKIGHAAPDSPDGYKLPDKANAPAFRALAFKHGLSMKQVEGMFADNEADASQKSAAGKARVDTRNAERETAMRKEWGSEYDANLELMNRGMEHFMPDEGERKFYAETGLLSPAMAKIFNLLGNSLKEGSMLPGTGAVTGPADKAGFRAERVKLEGQLADMKKQPGFDPINTGYRELMGQRNAMLRKEAQAHIAEQAKSGDAP